MGTAQKMPLGTKKIKFQCIRITTVSTNGYDSIIRLDYYNESGNLADTKEVHHGGVDVSFHFVTVHYESLNWSVLPASGHGVFEGHIEGNSVEFQSSLPYSGKIWSFIETIDFALGNIDWTQYGVPKVVLI